MQTNLAKGRERLDAYTLELQQHGLDSLEREVRWLNELISREESGGITATASSVEPGELKGSTTHDSLTQ
jgi:hypothetical protein